MDKHNKRRNSNWSKNADYRIKNRKWLRYSSKIARRILVAIESKEAYSQAELARTLGVSPQYINKIVKGGENLTLETIAHISDALGVELIEFPSYKYSGVSDLRPTYIIKMSAAEPTYAISNEFMCIEGGSTIHGTKEICTSLNHSVNQ